MKTKQVTPASAPKKRGRPRKNVLTPVNKSARKTPAEIIKQMEVDMHELQKLAMYWRDAYNKLEQTSRDSQAIVRYLERKIFELLGDE